MSLVRDQIINWLRKIDITRKTVLDVGSGSREKYASNWTMGKPKRYVSLDINKDFNPSIIGDLNKDTWEELNSQIKPPKTFDIVFCLETLEHCWNPLNAIKVLYEATKEKGTCYISAPFINPIHDDVDYLRYTDEWFLKALSEVGFKEVDIERIIATRGLNSLMSFYQEEAMKFSKIRINRGEMYKLKDIGYLVTSKKGRVKK